MNFLIASAVSSSSSGFKATDGTADIIQIIAACFFGLAILHTFSIKVFANLSHRFEKGTIKYNFFHFLAEVEAVFGIWAFLFILTATITSGWQSTKVYLTQEVNFTEPLFVFVIMTMAATAPIIQFTEKLIQKFCVLFSFLSKPKAFFCSTLILGPLLGSFITEPATMTVTALILLKNFFTEKTTLRFKYAVLALLLVNVSIGGTLTHFAAPPVLIVADAWGWDIAYMFSHFGWKSLIAVIINTFLIMTLFSKEIDSVELSTKKTENTKETTIPITLTHILFLVGVVLFAHDIVIFIAIFIFFLGWCKCSEQYQEPLKLSESLLVGFFLAGLVTLGGLQGWWIEGVITSLTSSQLFVSATSLTAITDNAALTYLGTLVPNLDDTLKFALVAGAVSGGGLTVIANAPNPAGFSILKGSFGKDGISAKSLLFWAILPTVVAMICLWFLPR